MNVRLWAGTPAFLRYLARAFHNMKRTGIGMAWPGSADTLMVMELNASNFTAC